MASTPRLMTVANQQMACYNIGMPFTPVATSGYQSSRLFEPRSAKRDFVRAWADNTGNEWEVRFSVQMIADRLSIADLKITPVAPGYPLTQTVLRQLPIVEWEREAFQEESAQLQTLTPLTQSLPHSGRRHSDDELRHVAQIYLTALNARLPVQKTVAETLGIPLSTATKRITAARRLGFLPPAARNTDSD